MEVTDARTDNEIQNQMQRLIILQNEQQKRQQWDPSGMSSISLSTSDSRTNSIIPNAENDNNSIGRSSSTIVPSLGVPYLIQRLPTTSVNTSPVTTNNKSGNAIISNSNSGSDIVTPTVHDIPIKENSSLTDDDDPNVVGQGTLIWTGGSIGKNNSSHLTYDMSNQCINDDGDSSTSDDGYQTLNQMGQAISSLESQQPQQQQQQPSSLEILKKQNHNLRQLFQGFANNTAEQEQYSSNETTNLMQQNNLATTKSINPELNNSKATSSSNAAVTSTNASKLYTSYGTVEEQTTLDPNTVPMPPGRYDGQRHHQYRYQDIFPPRSTNTTTATTNRHPQPNQKQQQQHQRQPYDSSQYQHDDDGYSNTGRRADELILEYQLMKMRRGLNSRKRSYNCCVNFCCSCFLIPIYNFIQDILNNQALHRSFCYGAIDGMLTGAGIVSTFCGMNMLQLTTTMASSGIGGFVNATAANTASSSIPSYLLYTSEIRAVVVVFTAATCFADSVCMALGHIWTTHVVASAQARERSDARCHILYQRNDAKGMLVDMLLQKGMLQIDAVSIADTLEGYPDLFVSALIGESLTAPNAIQHLRPQTKQQQQQHPDHSQDPTHGDVLYTGESDTNTSDLASSFPITETSIQLSEHSGHERSERNSASAYPRPGSSRHQYYHDGTVKNKYHDGDYDNDPESYAINVANQESKKESFFMMMGFSIFAVIPSLIFTWVPSLLIVTQDVQQPPGAVVSDFNSNSASYTSSNGTIMNGPPMIDPNSLAIALTACIMWFLGVWKSQYVDSNWLVFGFEAVSVLLVCIFCAYWLGAFLNHCFLPNEYEITVITTPTVSVSAPTPSQPLQVRYHPSAMTPSH